MLFQSDGGFPRVRHPPAPMQREARCHPTLGAGSSGGTGGAGEGASSWNLRKAREKKVYLELCPPQYHRAQTSGPAPRQGAKAKGRLRLDPGHKYGAEALAGGDLLCLCHAPCRCMERRVHSDVARMYYNRMLGIGTTTARAREGGSPPNNFPPRRSPLGAARFTPRAGHEERRADSRGGDPVHWGEAMPGVPERGATSPGEGRLRSPPPPLPRRPSTVDLINRPMLVIPRPKL